MLTALCIALAQLQAVGLPGRLVIIPKKDRFEFAYLDLSIGSVRHYKPPATSRRPLDAESAVTDQRRTFVAILSKDRARVSIYSVKKAALLCSLRIKDLGKGDRGIQPTVAWHGSTLCIYLRGLHTDTDLGSFAFSVGARGSLTKIQVPTPFRARIGAFKGKSKAAHDKLYADGDYPSGQHRLEPQLNRFEVFGDLYGSYAGSLNEDTGGFIARSGPGPDLRVYFDGQFAWTLSPKTEGFLLSNVRMGQEEVFLGFSGEALEVWSLETQQLLRRIKSCILVDE